MFRIEIYPSADKALKKINIRDRESIAKAIDKLSAEPRPHGYKKLKSSEFYRIRCGDYRVIYQIFDEKLIIVIVRIGHRREIYKS